MQAPHTRANSRIFILRISMEAADLLREIKRGAIYDIADNKAQYLLLVFFLVVGITAGTFTVSNMQSETKNALCTYAAVLFFSAKTAQLDYLRIFLSALFVNILYYGAFAWLSMTMAGIAFISVLMIVKGFCAGFAAGVLSLDFFGGGFGAILSCSLLPNIILLPCFIKAGVLSLNNSVETFKNRSIPSTARGRLKDAAPHFKRLAAVFFISILGLLIQTFVTPALIKI